MASRPTWAPTCCSLLGDVVKASESGGGERTGVLEDDDDARRLAMKWTLTGWRRGTRSGVCRGRRRRTGRTSWGWGRWVRRLPGTRSTGACKLSVPDTKSHIKIFRRQITSSSNSSLELLAMNKIPKRPLPPATEKSYGEAGVLLTTGYGRSKKFPKPCESCRCYGRWLWQKGLLSRSYDNSLSISLSLSRFLISVSLSYNSASDLSCSKSTVPKGGVEPPSFRWLMSA